MAPEGQETEVSPAINEYGDRLVTAGSAGFGGEISSQREDELDRLALREAKRLVAKTPDRRPVAYDIGCGRGAMTLKFAQAGCMVVACDTKPLPMPAGIAGEGDSIHVVEADARHVAWTRFPVPDILFSQRFLHYLRFQEAVNLVQSIARSSPYGSFFLSMSGLQSELGEGYPENALDDRFCRLAEPAREKHGIENMVCLYSLKDAERLAATCELQIVRLWLSDFGNVKLIATR